MRVRCGKLAKMVEWESDSGTEGGDFVVIEVPARPHFRRLGDSRRDFVIALTPHLGPTSVTTSFSIYHLELVHLVVRVCVSVDPDDRLLIRHDDSQFGSPRPCRGRRKLVMTP